MKNSTPKLIIVNQWADCHDRQARHPGVAEELPQQGRRALARAVRASGVGLPEAEHAQELAHRLDEQGDGHGGDHETDDERDDLQGRHGRGVY